jgi:predicted O-linked N-acetylglucosamine transferase (SPINDLY family)
MTLTLPQPIRPPSAAQAAKRAFRDWQRGREHLQQRRWPAAAEAFVRASELDGGEAYGLAAAHALIQCGRPDDAARRARQLRLAHPHQLLAYTLEAQAWLELGRANEALSCLRQRPGDLAVDRPFLVTLALALQRGGQHARAVPVFLQALALKMDDALLHYHLGTSFNQQGLKAEAAECVRTAVALGVGSSEFAARGQLLFLEREACRWHEADAELNTLRTALEAVPDDLALETSAFAHTVLVDDPIEQLKVARHYALHCATKTRALPRVVARAHAGRLRVGYLSADFHNHATSQLLVQMLECHDRAQFEIHCFSSGPDDGSALRRRVVAAVEHFDDVRDMPAQRIAERVRAAGIDILIDLKGATRDGLLPVMACRAAPLQATWLGYPGSTGAPYVDYLIGDAIVSPLAHAAHFSEKIAQLPHCYQPNDAQRARPQPSRRSDWGVPEGGLLLCAFHQAYKISAAVFDSWCRLLMQRPDATLWLLEWNANVSERLRAEARQRGIDERRLVFAPLLPVHQHLSRLACADIFLDTWPCNAHTTAGEALWVGVPVVTVCGKGFAQRVAASLLHCLQLDDLACRNASDYEHTVVQLAADADRRAALKSRLLTQVPGHRLFDGAAFARDNEALLQRMWQRAVQGLPPAALEARP